MKKILSYILSYLPLSLVVQAHPQIMSETALIAAYTEFKKQILNDLIPEEVGLCRGLAVHFILNFKNGNKEFFEVNRLLSVIDNQETLQIINPEKYLSDIEELKTIRSKNLIEKFFQEVFALHGKEEIYMRHLTPETLHCISLNVSLQHLTQSTQDVLSWSAFPQACSFRQALHVTPIKPNATLNTWTLNPISQNPSFSAQEDMLKSTDPFILLQKDKDSKMVPLIFSELTSTCLSVLPDELNKKKYALLKPTVPTIVLLDKIFQYAKKNCIKLGKKLIFNVENEEKSDSFLLQSSIKKYAQEVIKSHTFSEVRTMHPVDLSEKVLRHLTKEFPLISFGKKYSDLNHYHHEFKRLLESSFSEPECAVLLSVFVESFPPSALTTTANHSIALVRENDTFFCFNCNDTEIKKFTRIDTLTEYLCHKHLPQNDEFFAPYYITQMPLPKHEDTPQ